MKATFDWTWDEMHHSKAKVKLPCEERNVFQSSYSQECQIQKSLVLLKENPLKPSSLMKAHGSLWLVNPFPTSGAHVGYTRWPRLRVVLRRDHLTYERCATMGPVREEVMGWANLHFQKCSWPLSKHIPIATSPSWAEQSYQTGWRLIPLLSGTLGASMSSIAHVGETPKRLLEKEGLLHSAWLCPPRCCHQLLWVKMKCESYSARLPGTWGE